jgi:hypothetical protein
LTAAARAGAGCAGRDDGMAVLIEQQDDFWSGSAEIPIGSVEVQVGSGWLAIEDLVIAILATACALLAKQIL